MIVRILLTIWDVLGSCHCSPHGWLRGPLTGEWRCIAPLAHTTCKLDTPGWHDVAGVNYCSRDCGEEGTTG